MRTLLDRNNFSYSTSQVAAHRVTVLIINRLKSVLLLTFVDKNLPAPPIGSVSLVDEVCSAGPALGSCLDG